MTGSAWPLLICGSRRQRWSCATPPTTFSSKRSVTTFYASSPDAERRFLLGEWGARAKTSKDWWHLSFGVLIGDEVVGMQDITGANFPVVRTVNSFSFLGRRHQGRGIGREMRTAVLHLAFTGLGALRAESDAFDDNPASQRVSRALGYQPNGTLLAPRPSGAARMSRFLLTVDEWSKTDAAARDDIKITGLDEALPLLGLEPSTT